MKIFFLSLVLFAINLQLKAQDSLQNRNNIDGPIRVVKQKGLFGTIEFQTPPNRILSFKEVKLILKNNEASAFEYKIYQRSQITTLASSVIGLTSLLIGQGIYNRNNSGPFNAFITIGLGCTVIDLIYLYKSNRHFRRALLLYNNQFK